MLAYLDMNFQWIFCHQNCAREREQNIIGLNNRNAKQFAVIYVHFIS